MVSNNSLNEIALERQVSFGNPSIGDATTRRSIGANGTINNPSSSMHLNLLQRQSSGSLYNGGLPRSDSIASTKKTGKAHGTEILVRSSTGRLMGLATKILRDEFACPVCSDCIENPVHAPCGHSFCRKHLFADESAPDGG